MFKKSQKFGKWQNKLVNVMGVKMDVKKLSFFIENSVKNIEKHENRFR